MTRSEWTLTDHSRDSLQNRGISAIELRDLLHSPQIVQPDAKGLPNIRQYVGYGLTAIVDVYSRTVLTVKIDGSCKDEDADISRPPIILPNTYSLAEILAIAEESRYRSNVVPLPRTRMTSQPVGHIQVHPSIWSHVVDIVKERCGGDFRCVKVISPTKVEIDFDKARKA